MALTEVCQHHGLPFAIHHHNGRCLCVLEPHKKSQCSGNSHTKRPEKDEKRPLIKLDTSVPVGVPSTFQGRVKEIHGTLKLVDFRILEGCCVCYSRRKVIISFTQL